MATHTSRAATETQNHPNSELTPTVTHMHHQHISIAKTARYVTLGTLGPETRQIWFLCHGYSQLAEDFLAYCKPLEHESRFLIAPEGLSRFYPKGRTGKVGASWMTREDREAEITDYVAYLDAIYKEVFTQVGRGRITVHVLGFSQGVATACRWVARGQAKLDHLVMWSERLPPEFAAPQLVDRFRDLRLSVVNGRADEYIPETALDEHASRLQQLGLFFEDIRFDGGHRMDKETLKGLVREPDD